MLAYISCSFSCLCMLCKCLSNLWLACDLLCLLRWFACQFSCVYLCVAWIYICVVLWSYGIWSYMTMVLTMVYKNHLYNHQICYQYHKEININCMWIGSWRQLRQVYFSYGDWPNDFVGLSGPISQDIPSMQANREGNKLTWVIFWGFSSLRQVKSSYI